uniref:Uncharacterized protein n=1 Tax=Corvus moneduloides TaxID=1196302 RepID=A0A8U7NJK8_CORMO
LNTKTRSYISSAFLFYSPFSHQDVLTVTPWLVPIIWEGTFNPEILDSKAPPCPCSALHGLCLCRYTRFVQRFLESAERHLLQGSQVNYYTSTDSPEAIPHVQLQPGCRLVTIPIQNYSSWQEMSMCRMETINQHVAEVSHRCLFCLDISMVSHSPWGPEILGDVVAQFPCERRSSSAAFIPEGEGDFYCGGAVFGGLVRKVYELTKTCHMTILETKAKGIVAAWQEESHLNRHFLCHKPSKVLSPEYIWDDRKPNRELVPGIASKSPGLTGQTV